MHIIAVFITNMEEIELSTSIYHKAAKLLQTIYADFSEHPSNEWLHIFKKAVSCSADCLLVHRLNYWNMYCRALCSDSQKCSEPYSDQAHHID